jgi:uncharacterized protein (UPF0332 family)
MTQLLKQEYINYRIASAKETLQAAVLLAENQHWNSAINRLYYACFDKERTLPLFEPVEDLICTIEALVI